MAELVKFQVTELWILGRLKSLQGEGHFVELEYTEDFAECVVKCTCGDRWRVFGKPETVLTRKIIGIFDLHLSYAKRTRMKVD